MSRLRVLIAANGAGGRILPALPVTRELVARHSGELHFSGAGFADNYSLLAHNLYSMGQAGIGRVSKAVERYGKALPLLPAHTGEGPPSPLPPHTPQGYTDIFAILCR